LWRVGFERLTPEAIDRYRSAIVGKLAVLA